PGYLSYYLESPFVQLFLMENAKGTAQKGFYLKHLEKLACCVAPVPEQQRIVDRIESMFSKLNKAKENVMSVSGYNDTRNTMIGIIDTMKKSILGRAFRGELGTNRPNEERVSLD
ncbi:MAG: hypothetical protein IJK52_11520, partial [Oscillospiraceae bacterium]|nr:hypothetical protein [Oscillospiraceae bacterium]